jgi:hypothetical protein
MLAVVNIPTTRADDQPDTTPVCVPHRACAFTWYVPAAVHECGALALDDHAE